MEINKKLQTFPYGLYQAGQMSNGEKIDGYVILFQDDIGNDRFYACFSVTNQFVKEKEAFYNGKFELKENGKVFLQYFSTNGSWWIDGTRYGEIDGAISEKDEQICLLYNQFPFYKKKKASVNWNEVSHILENSMKDKGLL